MREQEPTSHCQSLSSDEALTTLIQGLQNFRRDIYPQQRELFKRLATAQQPRIMFITCADSRIVLELITQSEPGSLFVTRNVGNVVPPYGQMNGGVSSAIEYAVLGLGVEHIIVCGHSDCGAMKAVLNPASQEGMPTVKAWLRHTDVARSVVESHCNCAAGETLDVLTEENVVAQLDHLRTHPSVASRLASGRLNIHGWVYDIESCAIRAYDANKRRFVPLDGNSLPSASPQPRYAQA